MIKYLLFFLLSFSQIVCAKGAKIVGLVPVRNEARFIANCLKTLSQYTDAIVVLDDASYDNTLEIVESLKDECKIEKIISKKEWKKNESGDRLALLQAGRDIGGTHFIAMDADEMFSAQCLKNNWLRNKILSLNPGESISLQLIHPWKNIHFYTTAANLWVHLRCIFCDHPNAYFPDMFNQCARVPLGLNGTTHEIPGLDNVVVHLIFVNWRNFVIKRLWYMCLELVHSKNKNIQLASNEINELYGKTIFNYELFDNHIKCCNKQWYNYPFFNKFMAYEDEEWRKEKILQWFKEYGRDHFKFLNIWELPVEDM